MSTAFLLTMFTFCRMPTEAQIDAAPGLEETLAIEAARSENTPPLFSDAQIDAAPGFIPEPPLASDWWHGDFNIPTEAEVTAHAEWREKTYYKRCCAALMSAYRARSLMMSEDHKTVYLYAYNPMPEAQSDNEAHQQRAAALAFSKHVGVTVEIKA